MLAKFILSLIPYLAVVIFIVGYVIAWRKFRTSGIYGWSTLIALLLLILAASTDTGRTFEVMAPLTMSFLGFALVTLINL